MMQFRTAKNDDVDSVVKILTESRLEYLPYIVSPHTLDEHQWWVREVLIPTGGVVLATINSRDVAVLATSLSEGFGWIDQLYVAPGFISRGIGTALLSHAVSVLPKPIRLWTFQINHKAIRFYEHHGFVAIEFTDGENNEEKSPDVLYELK